MAASYPTSVKSFGTKAAADTIQAAHVNDLQDEVTAIETALLTSGFAHAVTITAGAGGASLTIPATGRIYLDGGSDTYLTETSANRLTTVVAGVAVSDVYSTIYYIHTDTYLDATKKLYLDSGGDTYIYESAANQVDFMCGSNLKLRLSTTEVRHYGNTYLDTSQLVSFGANDSGGTGYRLVRVPNA